MMIDLELDLTDLSIWVRTRYLDNETLIVNPDRLQSENYKNLARTQLSIEFGDWLNGVFSGFDILLKNLCWWL